MTTDQQEFVIPVKHEDLLEEDNEKYFVENQTNVSGMTPNDIEVLVDGTRLGRCSSLPQP